MPVVGILSQPWKTTNKSYIFGSYVKWLEAAGARTVPLLFDWPAGTMEGVLSQISGILFPGGGAPIDPSSKFGSSSFQIFKYALANRIPIWATCLGFEQVMTYSALLRNTTSPRISVDAENLLLPLSLTPGSESADLWSWLSSKSQEVLLRDPVTINMHQYAIAADDKEVPAFWRVLATGTDRNLVEFVSLAEALDYPIFTSQFHPEKNLFEYYEPYDAGDFPLSSIAHSFGATRAMAELAEYFVQSVIKGRFAAVRMNPRLFRKALGFFLFRPTGHIVDNATQHYLFSSDHVGAHATGEFQDGRHLEINTVPAEVFPDVGRKVESILV